MPVLTLISLEGNAAMQHLLVSQLHSWGRILNSSRLGKNWISPGSVESKYMRQKDGWMAFSSASPFFHPPLHPVPPPTPTPPHAADASSAHLRQ